MTYLEAINKVLRGLREPQVTSLSEEYPKMIGQFVNEAKQDLEDIGPWFPLRFQQDTVVTTGNYTLNFSGTNDRSYLLYDSNNQPMVFITTADSERRLVVITDSEMRALRLLNPDQQSGTPVYISFSRQDDGLDGEVFPHVDQDYTIRCMFVIPQNDLDGLTDEFLCPAEPIWREALVRAMEERGEDFANQTLERAYTRAARSLDAAMLRDFGAQPMTFSAG